MKRSAILGEKIVGRGIEGIEMFVEPQRVKLLAAFEDGLGDDVPTLPPSLRSSASNPTAAPRSSRGM